MTDHFIRITRRETLYQGHFRLLRFRFRHKLHGGGWSTLMSREVFDRGNAVALLLYDPRRDAVVLTEQFRIPAYLSGYPAVQIETVAGLLDKDGETEETVARREAEEEAGVTVPGELIPMQRLLLSPGGSTEGIALYCAEIDSRRAGGIHGLAEEGEDIKVVVKSYAEAIRMLRAGEITNATATVALYWLKDNRVRLKRRWAHARRKPRLASKSARA